MDLGLGIDLWPWVWLAVAVTFVLAELTVLGGSLIVLPFGVSAFIAALLAFGDVGLGVQWVVFVGGGLLLFGVFWRYQSLVQRGNTLPPGVGAVRLVGLTGVVAEDVDPADEGAHGRVVVNGEHWFARTDGPEVLPAGTRVRVLEVEGTRVRVAPATDDSATTTDTAT